MKTVVTSGTIWSVLTKNPSFFMGKAKTKIRMLLSVIVQTDLYIGGAQLFVKFTEQNRTEHKLNLKM